jgi:hypothetical protein
MFERPPKPPLSGATIGLTLGFVLFVVFALVLIWLGLDAEMAAPPTTDHHVTTTTSDVP